MSEIFSLYFDLISKDSPWNSHHHVDLLLRLRNLVDRNTNNSNNTNTKSAEILNFFSKYNAQFKSATNDAVDANAIHRLIKCRDTYCTPYVHSSLEDQSPSSLMTRIESAAKELGLEAFQDHSTHAQFTVHTVTIAGTILVIDVDLTSSPNQQPSLTRLQTSYATNSNSALEPIDKLLVNDLNDFVAPKSDLSSTESTPLRSERAFQRFKRNLHQLVLLDKLSQNLGNENDLFVSFEALIKAFVDLCSAENSHIWTWSNSQSLNTTLSHPVAACVFS
ncbi:hypothetical protein E3P81_00841 [Wallemia ichthyophaga]|nr:hypothetical protein E3P97_00842 [Wallemia ichthyophaga]TIB35047.1 hypothetical protein E3P85_00583 [Wallemia ichthyophaga]TIB49647.1 hypothetical protein E3P82_00839 [Wallemia ichthyophaga]TIB53370.1 hypothetical protein E3P81_00841 [Wallemia ichthyophaga]TIB56125.1 hypothetical protein E3P80_00840 [Wallemia ichthyophaga]